MTQRRNNKMWPRPKVTAATKKTKAQLTWKTNPTRDEANRNHVPFARSETRSNCQKPFQNVHAHTPKMTKTK